MRKISFLFFIITTQAFASGEFDPSQCRSQLMRMQIDSSAINGMLQNSEVIQSRALPALQTFVASDAFKESFLKDYPLEPVGFPFDKEICEREKSRTPELAQINCSDANLCGNPSVPELAKKRICLALPCSFLMGNRMSECASEAEARPTTLTFNSPVQLKKLNLNPDQVTIVGNRLSACFGITEMEVDVGVGVSFDTRENNYSPMALNNLSFKLDGPRRVCISANIDVSKNPILSGVDLQNQDSSPFISNAMIDQALRGASVTGLTGYSPETIEILKRTGLPPMARHFRPSLEEAVTSTLSSTFESTISSYMSTMGNSSTPSRVDTPADSMVSELGVGNLVVKKYVDLVDCAIMKKQGQTIPATHGCLTNVYSGEHPYPVKKLPNIDKALEQLQASMNRNSNVTSESIQRRLEELGPRMRQAGLENQFTRSIRPMIDQISVNQTSSTLMSGIELVGNLNSNSQFSVGFCLPELCDQQNPSTHAGRSIPNCPIQTYVDINELNNLIRAMYDSGRLCHRGRGDFNPRKNNRGEILRDNKGFAQGDGCVFAVEEDPDGMRCYLNGPPEIKYDSSARRYNVSLKTKECLRGGVFIGQGKIGGDINFDIGFTPSICNGGDFCLENGEANWSVVEGTARYALRESSFFNGIVRSTIDKNLSGLISDSLRFPVASTQGPLSNVPIVPEGRVDMGDGYFGACLKIK